MTRLGGTWQNWGRTEKVTPQRVEFPSSAGAVQRAVRAAKTRGLTIKAVGAGHSFTGIAVAKGVLLDLADLTGLVSVDRDRNRATLRAGTRLRHIPKLLAPYGLAMPNLGDIDAQSIAGATATGTHGTGLAFGGLATQIVGATIVTAEGDLMHVNEGENSALLPAVALGLGALGILVDVTLQCVPAFVLHGRDTQEPLAPVLQSLQERIATADHFEFFWFAGTEVALTRTNTRLPESAPRERLSPVSRWADEELLTNGVWGAACAVGSRVPALVPSFARLAASVGGQREHTDDSHRVLTQRRAVRFREMEYAVPLAHVGAAFEELRAEIIRRKWRISFPVEVRAAAADDRWLSTAYGRDSAYIAVHRYWREDPTEYFDAAQEIFLAHEGRPHWGKMHTLSAEQLRPRYERFDDFLALRDQLDPQRRFQNDHLARVLGE